MSESLGLSTIAEYLQPPEPQRTTPKLAYRLDKPDAPRKPRKGSPHFRVLFHKAYLSAASGKHDLAIKGFEQTLRVAPQFAAAHYNLGATFFAAGEFGKAFGAFRRAIEFNEGLISAHFGIGCVLSERGRHKAALAIFEQVVRGSETSKPPLREFVASALVNKGFTLGKLDRRADALAVYDDLLARFGTATELPLRQAVANALRNKGVMLSYFSSRADALVVYNDLLTRFGTATELPLREEVGKTLISKYVTLVTAGLREAALAVCDDLLARFGPTTEPPLRKYFDFYQVARAATDDVIAALNRPLVSPETVHDNPMPGEPTTPDGAAGQPRPRSALQVPEAGHELTRPAQTPAVEWPAAGWQKLRGQGGAKKMHAIVDYLRVKWKPFLDATGAAVTLEILEQKDPGAGTALRRYMERHPMPEELRFVRHDEVLNILAERPTRLVDVALCRRCNVDMQ